MYLSKIATKVIAVDPAPLDDEITPLIVGTEKSSKEANVVYIPQLLQNCEGQVKTHGPFQLICSDATVSPGELPELVASLTPRIAAERWCIATLKLKNKPGTGKGIADAFEIDRLKQFTANPSIPAPFTFLVPPLVATTVVNAIINEEMLAYECHCVWLFANTENERTLLLKKLKVL